MPIQSKSAAPQLQVGASAGELRVTAFSRNLLVLSAPQTTPLIFCLIGVACLFGGIYSLRPHPSAGGLWLFIISFALLAVGISKLGLSYTIDGAAGEIVKRRLIPVRRWATADLQGVSLTVTHKGPQEILRLDLVKKDGNVVVVTISPTDTQGVALCAAGAAITSILPLPLLRSGAAVQGAAELKSSLQSLQPDAAPGDGMDLRINCPRCKAQNVPAVAHVLVERRGAITWKTNWVRCSACGKDLYSKVPAAQLSGLSAQELERVVINRVSLIGQVLAVLSVVLGVLPVMGLAVALPSLAVNWKAGGWLRRCSLIGVILSAITTTLVVTLVHADKHNTPQPHRSQSVAPAQQPNPR